MAKISFPTKPQKVFYSYLPDGHIYDITTTKPSVVADDGGYWSCYFECTPYHKDTDGSTYLIYEVIVSGADTKYVAVSSDSYMTSDKTYKWTKDGKTYTTHSKTTKYYSRNGLNEYSMPKNAAELPQISYQGSTYYIDSLIKRGAKYDATNKKFIPMDVKKGAGQTTFGDVLLDLIKSNVIITNFDGCVNAIPEYLTGPDLTAEYSVESIGYSVPANYFIMFGVLFVDKLNEAMKEKGDSIVKTYMAKPIETQYKKVTIETSVAASGIPVGTITSTPEAELKLKA